MGAVCSRYTFNRLATTSGQSSAWRETPWVWNEGYGEQTRPDMHVVAIDYGIKRNILRLLAGLGARVTVVRDGHTREVTVTVAERPRLPSDLVE